jgi:DNA-binding SARP family transcriptional activator
MNQAYFKYRSLNPEAALDDLEAGLSLMKTSGYDHFWSWEPKMMTTLLGFAVTRDIEKNFADTLARKRLGITFSDKGQPFPLLTFTLLDSFSISLSDKILFQEKDLTPYQRELLGLLITAKGQRIPQDKIQLELWPDNSPDNARKSFDTLLARLRKLLKSRLPVDIKNYIFMQKGILCLVNCNIDALDFTEAARSGLSHNKNGDRLQAHNAFQRAFSLYRGVLPEETFRSEQVLSYNDQLIRILVEFTTIWATNMEESGQTEEAISLIGHILQINFLEEELIRLLYRLYNRNNNPLKACETLQNYKKALIKAGYTKEETTEFIDEITAG